jgi:hypothetical protein
MPRYMMFVVANAETETAPGSTPDSKVKMRDMMQAMAKFNRDLIDAGLCSIARANYMPTSDGYRVQFSETDSPKVEQGPFDLAKQGTVSGHWILQADNFETMLEWAKKVPFKGGKVEVRRISELEDFGDLVTDEMKNNAERLQAQVEQQK